MDFKNMIDKNFEPIIVELNKYKKLVEESNDVSEFAMCIERFGKFNYIYKLNITNEDKYFDKTYNLVERLFKTLLWVVGGEKIYISGCRKVYENLSKEYSLNGKREFDYKFFNKIFEKEMIIEFVEDVKDLPKEMNNYEKIGGHLSGCRIGFDAGGSDRKVSAVIDGEVVYSKETVWHPKLSEDYTYQYEGIKESMLDALSHLPRLDAIGVSSAGIYIDNQVKVASLFNKIPENDFKKFVKNIYIDIAKEIGDAPLQVVNDGDVTALAGAMDLKDNSVLGIAMGTSEAVGYINENGCITNWFNELAFVPIDMSEKAMVESDWSNDKGVGSKYLSQDGVIKLAEMAGFEFEENLSPADKLKVIQNLASENNKLALDIYENIGVYLGYAIAYYCEFYKIKHCIILGRVTSGIGGEIILDNARKVLAEEFKSIPKINIIMPSENMRRVGQSIAAASLPEKN